eukprot:m.307704 g.307704  ORF g.307704 m.307704 type:complete len:329 (+) comp42672_c0_seq1:373-1359(+)
MDLLNRICWTSVSLLLALAGLIVGAASTNYCTVRLTKGTTFPVFVGENIGFHCFVGSGTAHSGVGSGTATFLKDGRVVTSGRRAKTYHRGQLIFLIGVTPKDSGNYTCVSTEKGCLAGQPLSLVVREKPLLSALTPKYQKLTSGDPLTLVVNVTNFERCKPITTVWKNAKNESVRNGIQSQSGGTLLLMLIRVNKYDAEEISVTVYNGLGNTTMTFHLSVTVNRAVPSSPSVSVAVKLPTNSPLWKTANVPYSNNSRTNLGTQGSTPFQAVNGALRPAAWNIVVLSLLPVIWLLYTWPFLGLVRIGYATKKFGRGENDPALISDYYSR